MLKAFEIRQKRAGFVAEARKVADAAGAENRSLTADENGKVDGFLKQAADLVPEIERIERMEAVEAELRSAPGRPLGDQLPTDVEKRHSYSVLKAMRQDLARREGRGKLDGIEAETHQELEKRRGRAAEGVLIPYSLTVGGNTARGRAELRTDLTTTTGAGSIPTILSGTLIDILRARMVTQAAGATVMEGMQGLFAIPRQSGTNAAYWVAEGSGITTGNQTIDQVPFTPKTVGGMTNYSRRFVEQTNQNSEEFVRNDLTAIVARGLETAALNGVGVGSNQPLGILQTTAIQTLNTAAGLSSGANGGPLTWANLILLEQAVATANADLGKLGYITDAAVRGHMKRTAKIGSTFPVYLWTGGPTPVNEYPAYITNLLPSNLVKGSAGNCHALIYGNWADLIYALWSGMDVVVDPYTGAAAGAVRIVVLQDADINIRHPESFAFLADVIPS